MTCGPTTLEIIRDEEKFLALGADWESLHERSAVRTPFRTWDWTRLWWKHFGDRFQLRVGLLRDSDGAIVAIAPFALGNEEVGARRHLNHLTLLGGMGEVSSEGLDFLIAKGNERTLLPRFEEMFVALRDEWQVVDIPYLQEDSPSLFALDTLLAKVGTVAPRSQPNVGHVLTLAKTWDEQLAGFSRNRRSDIRSKWKKLIANHKGRPLVGGKDLSASAAMDALFGLHRTRFAKRLDTTFVAPRAEAFHRELVELWQPQNKILISLLEADGTIVAARYGFVYNERYWDYQSGFDESLTAISIGNLNLSWAVQCAISLGLKEYDHLSGDQAYKHAWSTHTRRYLYLESLNSRSLSAQFFKFSRFVKRLCSGSPAAPSDAESIPKSSPATA